jgi:uncharacterized protein (TIGR02145 family)
LKKIKNKKMKWYFLIVGLFVLSACKKLERTNPIDGIQGITTGDIKQLSYSAIQLNAYLSEIKDVAYVTQKGFCYSTYNNPNLYHNLVNAGSGFGDFSSEITNLTINKTYYFRAFASNDKSTAYGQVISFRINGPEIQTHDPTNITYTSAKIGMSIINAYDAQVLENGVCWGTYPGVSLNDNVIKFSASQIETDLYPLEQGKSYYVRSYIITNYGTIFGEEKNFITNGTNKPTVLTRNITSIGSTSAKCGGENLLENGMEITRKGVCWSSTNSEPTVNDYKTEDGIGDVNFVSELKGLTPNTSYYLRAYAENSVGVGYGEIKTFTTYINTISDIDGNTYKTVTIGDQDWMAENLKTTSYNNGISINQITSKIDWKDNNDGGYCYSDFNSSLNSTYGKLYNGFVVRNVNGNNVCPSGWHVPSKSDWQILANTLQGFSDAGGKLKEVGTTTWVSPNTAATNSSGFTARPGGKVDLNGNFTKLKSNGYWWSLTTDDSDNNKAYYIDLGASYGLMNMGSDYKNTGFSIRCVKD